MIAVILNSGMGTRMGACASSCPKCLIEIAPDATILSHQLDLLLETGIEHFVITTGYLEEMIREYVGQRYSGVDIRFVYNPEFRETNYITSLHCAQEQTQDDILLLHGDLVFSNEVLHQIIAAEGNGVVIDSTIPLSNKDFKARVTNHNRVIEIGTGIRGADCCACQPLYKLEKRSWNMWQRAIDDFCIRGLTWVYAEDALNGICGNIDLHGLDIKGKLCMEIDDEQDWELLRNRL